MSTLPRPSATAPPPHAPGAVAPDAGERAVPLRTLIAAHALGWGGMTRYLAEHGVALRRLGCAVTILTPPTEAAGSVLGPALEAGCTVRWVERLGARALRRAFREVRPDLLRLCTGKAPPDTRLIAGQIGGGAAILESIHLPSRRARPALMQRVAYRLRPRRRYRVLAFSRGMFDWLARATPALRPCLRHLTYGLALPAPAARPRRAPTPGGPVRLLVLTRLDERQKDTVCLLRAVAGSSALRAAARVEVRGEGPDRAALEALTRELGLDDAVSFAGWTPEPLARLAEADILVNSTRVESFGRINVEAAAVGTPVVASRVMGCEESVDDEGSGLLVPPGDPAALAQAIERLQVDAALWRRFSDAGPAWAARFDALTHARAVLALAHEAVAPPA